MAELTPEELQKIDREKAEREKLDREKLQALGYDADNQAVLRHYQELQGKVADERLTHLEAERAMRRQSFEIADKERRDAVKQEETVPRGKEKDEPGRERRTAEKDITAERMAGREQKEEAQKLDVERFRSDPDYRREVKAHTAQQLKAERQQHGRYHELERDDRQQ